MAKSIASINSSPRSARPRDELSEIFPLSLLPFSRRNSPMANFRVDNHLSCELDRRPEPLNYHISPNLSFSNSFLEAEMPQLKLDSLYEPIGYKPFQFSSENDSNSPPRDEEMDVASTQGIPLYELDFNRKPTPLHDASHLQSEHRLFGQLGAINPNKVVYLPDSSSILQCRKPLPPLCPELGNEPVYVNAKQYQRILVIREKKRRAGTLKTGNYVLERPRSKTYRHESRSQHAKKRVRDSNGRFPKKDELCANMSEQKKDLCPRIRKRQT